MRRLILLLAGLVLAPQLPGAQDDSPQKAKEARKLYVAKCARCHPLYDARAYTQEDWDAWLRKMGPKTKLKAEQQELLSKYRDKLNPRPKTSPR